MVVSTYRSHFIIAIYDIHTTIEIIINIPNYLYIVDVHILCK